MKCLIRYRKSVSKSLA